MKKLRDFFCRHPVVRDAFLWAFPALICGAFLRGLLMSYLPYGYWGADSRSNFSFAHILIHYGGISIGGKRRFLYPILLLPLSVLPGGALRWLPLFQHTAGVMTLVPLAYVVRKTLRFWKIWIVPITLLYACLPIVFWYEHEMVGDDVFFQTFAWAFAGWAAWIGQATVERSRRMFWWFLVPFALCILTRPAGRFIWPGLLVGLVIVAAWKLLTRRQVYALLAVLLVSPTVGSNKQGAWLFYQAVFPLTRVETPLHAEYKIVVKDFVMRMRDNLDTYWFLQDEEPYHFLRDPELQNAGPLWTALGEKGNERLKNEIYMDLAWEGIKARPDLFLYLALERFVATGATLENYDPRIADGAFTDGFAEYYQEAVESEDSPVRLVLGLPSKGPIPPYEQFRRKMEPAPGSWRARAVQGCDRAYGKKLNLFRFPDLPWEQCKISLARPTFLFWWTLAGGLLSLLPRYRRTLGVWAIISAGYVCGVFLVTVVEPRFFAPVWPVLLPLLAIPADIVLSLVASRSAKPGV